MTRLRPATGRRHRRPRSQAGQILVWTSFLLPIMLLAAGLTFDVGNMIQIRSELETAVDAAALAGARAMFDPSTSETFVRNSTKNVAFKNEVPTLLRKDKSYHVTLDLNTANAAGGDMVLGRYDFTLRAFTPAIPPLDMSKVNAVQVNARLSRVAATMPLAFGSLAGLSAFDTSRRAIAVLAAPSQGKATAPIAIDVNVFNGKTKGFLPPNDVVVSTKLDTMAWTGYLDSTNASKIRDLSKDPSLIPLLSIGATISLAFGEQATDYKALKDAYPPGSNIIVPVVLIDASKMSGVIKGFATLKIDAIQTTANPKYVDATLITNKANLDPTTTADCYGTDCRAFLVN